MTNLWFPKSLFPKTINEQENKLNQNLKKPMILDQFKQSKKTEIRKKNYRKSI